MTITVDTNSHHVRARLVNFHENTLMGIRLSRGHDTAAPLGHTVITQNDTCLYIINIVLFFLEIL